MDLWVVFLTGLTVGGLTCLAVQGGLLASVIASREEEVETKIKKHALYATGAFLVAKLIAYVILGFLLGGFGNTLNISGNVQSIMQLLAGVYMIAVALNLLDIHPIFRYVIIQPPRFLTRLVRNKSKSRDIFAPLVLGAMTIFIPCGTTLAMEALAISSANPITGALIMGAFILGTVPLFFGIGFVTSLLGESFKTKFLKIAAVAIIYLGITSLNGALYALGSPLTLQSIGKSISIVFVGSKNDSKKEVSANQNPQIYITSSGYSPNYIQVKKGEKVTLKVTNDDAYSCASAFRIPSLGLGADLAPGNSQTFTFTPQEKGEILFSCSMGMYRGVIEVL
jgi:uncharacterized protein